MADESGATGDLQFDKAETKGAANRPVCAGCSTEIAVEYYTINTATLCVSCKVAISHELAGGSGLVRFVKATAGGLGGGAVGAGIWGLVMYYSNSTWGIIAVVLGILVGSGVRWGAERRGGVGYQLLAVVITYLAVVAAFVPTVFRDASKAPQTGWNVFLDEASPAPAVASIVKAESTEDAATVASVLAGGGLVKGGLQRESAERLMGSLKGAGGAASMREVVALPGWAIFLVACVVSAVAPFASGIITVLIVGFALYEAWKLNVRANVAIEGPFRVAAS